MFDPIVRGDPGQMQAAGDRGEHNSQHGRESQRGEQKRGALGARAQRGEPVLEQHPEHQACGDEAACDGRDPGRLEPISRWAGSGTGLSTKVTRWVVVCKRTAASVQEPSMSCATRSVSASRFAGLETRETNETQIFVGATGPKSLSDR